MKNNFHNELVPMEIGRTDIPSIIKYMGSKKPIIDFIVDNIHEIHTPGAVVCDLFSGSCSISAALRKKYNFISNDIQQYSTVLAQTYFSDFSNCDFKSLKKEIETTTKSHVQYFEDNFAELFFNYSEIKDVENYQKVELMQRKLHAEKFDIDYHLFSKHYSGTYWSFEQCVWIDALRKCTEKYKGQKIYFAMLSSIMHSMSYTTQSTGHFAQYRDGNSIEAMKNILIYRVKSIYKHFIKKLEELVSTLDNHLKSIETTSLSFDDCLKTVPHGSTIYADPPYAPVHYSRFYHVLETLVKYDYPKLEFKGRYRDDRHQSPFSQKTNAIEAFTELFHGIIKTNSQMLLSYSGSGVVSIEKIISLAHDLFANGYVVEVKELNHRHSTMGRFDDQSRDVVEYLIIAKYNN